MEGGVFSYNLYDGKSIQELYNVLFAPEFEECATGSETESVLAEEDLLEKRLENTDTEQEATDNEGEVDSTVDVWYSKDRSIKWSKRLQPKNSSTATLDVVQSSSGITAYAKNAKNPIECWNLMFTDEMIDGIVLSTNYQISLIKDKYSRPRDASGTDVQEIKGLLGILYLIGLKNEKKTSTSEIWSQDMTGIEFCRAVMSERRFKFLIRNIRFDDKRTRSLRQRTDNLAPVREMFEKFVENSQKCYTIGEFCTIDEKLEAFRGSCPFRQYVPSKPAKYGIKMYALCDAKTYYTSNLEIYAGKQPDGPFSLSSTQLDVVMRLSKPIHGTGRNITMDSWFTSYVLAVELLKKKLTLVGSLRINKNEIPPSFLQTKNRLLHSSMFAYQENKVLLSYKAKTNKFVILLSTMPHDNNIVVIVEKDKPNLVTFYNATKSVVETVDQLCSTYDVSRNTGRWPMVVFYSLLNLAGVNSLIIYNSNQCKGFDSRRKFLKSLAFDLAEEHIKKRFYEKHVPQDLSLKVERLFNLSQPAPVEVSRSGTSGIRKRCHSCERKTNRVTSYTCEFCKKYICLKDHTVHRMLW